MLTRIGNRQIQFADGNFREMVGHIVAESDLAIGLLLTRHPSVLRLFHHHNFLLARSHHHQHFRREIAAGKRILAEERQRPQVGHIRVEQHEGNVAFVELVGEAAGCVEVGRHDDQSVGFLGQNRLVASDERVGVEAFVVANSHIDVELAPCLHRLQRAFFNLDPVRLLFVFGHEHIKRATAVVGQCRGVCVGRVVQLFQCLFHLFSGWLRHVWPCV